MRTPILLAILLTSVCSLLNKDTRDGWVNKSDPHIRPSEQTTVEMVFVLVALNKLDSVKQELGTTFLLYMRWTDPKLKSPPPAESIVVYVNEIWTPPLVVGNAIKDSMFLLRDDIFPMRVDHTGTVTWIPRLSPTTTCEVDTSLFPVDIQVCDISITSWVHSTKELILVKGNTSHYPDPINKDFYSEDKSWELIKTSVEVDNLTGGYGIEYHQVNYRFFFRRHERFYWVLLVIPGICLAFLQPLVFLIPLNDNGPRMSYATAMLFSFILYGRVFIGLLPPIFNPKHDHVFGETFGQVLICCTAITVLVIVELVVTSCLKKKHSENEKGTNLWCIVGSDDCNMYCFKLQLANGFAFVVFFIVYIVGMIYFVVCLKKMDAPSVNLS